MSTEPCHTRYIHIVEEIAIEVITTQNIRPQTEFLLSEFSL